MKYKLKNEVNETMHDELSCGCGHCHDDKETTIKRSDNKFAEFVYNYGIDLIKIIISIILVLLASFLPVSYVAKLILYVISAFVVGYNLLYKLIKSAIKGNLLDENTLMVIASVAAFVLGEYFEGALIIILFVFGELLEKIATSNARRKIAGLAELKVDVVNLFTKDGVLEVSPEKVPVGSLIQIKRGDRIPIDGILIGGSATLDMKALTGESEYYHLSAGDDVLSGGVNVGEAIVVKTEKEYENSAAQRIITLVENSLSKKAKTQKFITKFAKVYTPIIVAIGLILSIVPPLFTGYNFAPWIYKALNFIVISCPCALVISVPLAFFIGIGGLAKKGVLVKGSCYIETLTKVNKVVFDKTGTLTNGQFKVVKVEHYGNFDKKTVLSYAYSLEKYSNHPIAQAVCSSIEDKIQFEFCDVNEIAGKGLTGYLNGRQIVFGNYHLVKEYSKDIVNKDFVGTILYLVVDGELACVFYLVDTVKKNALKAIKELKKVGVEELTILSGDKFSVVESVTKELGVDNAKGELLPEEKLSELNRLKSNSKDKLLYAGDGINDAPCLVSADIGVAMGGLGSGLAVESADVIITDDDIIKIVTAIKHSKKIKKIVLQNVISSITIKIAIMVLSLVINLPVWLAMFADVGIMILAILNSLRCGVVKNAKTPKK